MTPSPDRECCLRSACSLTRSVLVGAPARAPAPGRRPRRARHSPGRHRRRLPPLPRRGATPRHEASGSSRGPVPAGMSLPMMTFSLRPRSRSILPEIAASVSTRVVSWNDAAESQDAVLSAALMRPSSTVCAMAGSPPSLSALALDSSHSSCETISPGSRSVSPALSMRTFRIICRTMTSMCLSLMSTPWVRYTRWTSRTR